MSATSMAYGGVVIDGDGRILLREAKDHKYGDVWTFPKGRKEDGEDDEEAALRETLEETGWSAEVIQRIPGMFEGTTTRNIYFLMQAGERVSAPGGESEAIVWVTPDEAPAYLRRSWSHTVVKRELDVLKAALKLLKDVDR